MIRIFETDCGDKEQAALVVDALTQLIPAATAIEFDSGSRQFWVEAPAIDTVAIVAAVKSAGFYCEAVSAEDAANEPEDMQAFWNNGFRQHREMWGFEPARSAIAARDHFVAQGVRDLLIPGFGYGRNARIFMELGIKVTGIEISEAAIELARRYCGDKPQIFHGSVTDMPLDDHLYDGIFCYGLLYLLAPEQRRKMIRDCYQQLMPGGLMIFAVVSKDSPNYGKGKEVRKDTFEIGKGGQVFFYDEAAVKQEFGPYGLISCSGIEEQIDPVTGKAAFAFMLITCCKA